MATTAYREQVGAGRSRRLSRLLLLVIGCMGVLVLGVATQAWPSSEAVRLRNALLMSFSIDAASIDWRSDRQPPGFLLEDRPAPEAMRSQVASIAADSDLALARALASHLVERLKDDEGPVRSLDIDTTYRAITERGAGYCSDVVDAFTALAIAAGLPVRQWAFSFDGFGGHGHVIAEIFDRKLGAWVALDVFNNVMPVRSSSGDPLSATALRSLLLDDERLVQFIPIGPGRPGFVHSEKLYEYYRKGLNQWYFWNGNNVITRGQSAVVRTAAALGEPVGELVVVASGQFPSIVPVRTPANASLVDRMQALQWLLVVVAFIFAVLTVMGLVLLLLLLRERIQRGLSRS